MKTLDDVYEQLKAIKRRLDRLEGYRPDGPSPAFPVPPSLGGAVTCPECGMRFEGVMNYSCVNVKCPMMMVIT